MGVTAPRVGAWAWTVGHQSRGFTGWRPPLRFPQTQGAWGLGGYGGALAAPGAQYPKKTSTLAPPGLASPFLALTVTGHPWGWGVLVYHPLNTAAPHQALP